MLTTDKMFITNRILITNKINNIENNNKSIEKSIKLKIRNLFKFKKFFGTRICFYIFKANFYSYLDWD